MNFPSRLGDRVSVPDIPKYILEALGKEIPVEAYQSRDLMLVYKDENVIREMQPDLNALMRFKPAIIVTANAENKYDFVSRFFHAIDAVPEDPVTGSAHCTLAPYWAQKLGKDKMLAYQASKRGGELALEMKGDRVLISGHAVTVLDGNFYI